MAAKILDGGVQMEEREREGERERERGRERGRGKERERERKRDLADGGKEKPTYDRAAARTLGEGTSGANRACSRAKGGSAAKGRCPGQNRKRTTAYGALEEGARMRTGRQGAGVAGGGHAEEKAMDSRRGHRKPALPRHCKGEGGLERRHGVRQRGCEP